MAGGIFTIGVTGLNAAQYGLQTASHNIANASTEGFSRQRIVQTTNTPLYSGSGYLGQGTNVLNVERSYSKFLTEQVLQSQSGASEMDAYLTQLNQIDNLLADASAGLSPSISSFFSGIQSVASSPASLPARQSMLSSAEALVSRFHALDQRLTEIRDGTNQQIQTEATTINALAQQLAEVNQRIILAQSSGGQQPNDIYDQRDQLVADLNKEVRAQGILQTDGTYSIFIGNGQPLVIGTLAYSLKSVQSTEDPEKLSLAITNPMGATVYLKDDMLAGGALGGLLSFRNDSLDAAQNGLGRVAIAMAETFNQIHKTGQDLTGALGGNFFDVAVPSVKTNSLNTGDYIASASIVNRDYRIEFGGGGFSIYAANDATNTPLNFVEPPSVASATVSASPTTVYVDGVKIVLAGAPAAGDTFVVRPGNDAGSRVIAGAANQGTGTVDSGPSNIEALEVSDYRLDVMATGGPVTLRMTRTSDNTTWSGTGGSVDEALNHLASQQQFGFSVSMAGTTLNVNDSFLIRPTREGARNIGLATSDPRAIAAAAPFRTTASGTNVGTAKISNGSVEHVAHLPLAVSPGGDVTLTFNATLNQFTVAGAVPAVANPIAYNPATQTSIDVEINGMRFTISGAPSNGDTFKLMANANGVADNRTAQLLGGLQTAKTMAATSGSTTTGGTASFTDAYGQIVSVVGNKAREVTVTGEAQQILNEQANTMREQMAGVNLDEEAANLMRYQQAYQAAAKMLEIASNIFDELLALGR